MDDFNLEEFAKMFDTALASDNPAVKKALRNFMMVTALVHAQEDDERNMGPLETLVKKVSDLDRLVHELRHNKTRDYKDYYYGNNPTWVSTTPYPTTWNGINVSTSTTSATSQMSATEISQLFKELKNDFSWKDSDIKSITEAFKDADGN
jgi:hypothetical protein